MAGRVFSGDRPINKAGELLPLGTPLAVRDAGNPYVSRGGLKLEGALDAFGLNAKDIVAADFGASTGGFTDCLLQRGARRVYAIDVGYGQLDAKLRSDPRVVVMERRNARYLSSRDLQEPVQWVVIDASFISLGKLLSAAYSLLEDVGEVVALVKPQFEVEREKVEKGGIVRDEQDRLSAIENVARQAKELGFEVAAGADSVVAGPRGNREHFLWLRKRHTSSPRA